MADSVLQSPTNPHFFQPLLPGFHSYLKIPVAFFSEYLLGRNENKTARLRLDASDITWEVEIDDGWRLTGGWKEFVTAHALREGDVLVFRHEGDLVFHVTALGPSCCDIQYASVHNIDDDSDDHGDNIASQIEPTKKRKKKNPKREEEDSSSDHSCFVANLSLSSLRNDKLYIPVDFVRSNGLTKRYCKVILLNEMGRSWKLSLDHDKSGMKSYLRYGWRRFCKDNELNRGRCYTFKLVRKSGTPVIRLCQAGCKPLAESSSSDSSCFVGSLTPSSIRNDALYLPRRFVKSNGLKEGCCEMVLKNENGGTWDLILRHNKKHDMTYVTRGWNSFCEANRIKGGDSFKFKLVENGVKAVLCLCSTETNRDTEETTDANSIPTNPSSGEESSETEESEEKSRDNMSVKEASEEESIEEKSSSRECLNNEKWKYCSKAGASSDSSCFVGSVTPSSLLKDALYLPKRFVSSNGLKERCCEVVLKNENGGTWKLGMRHHKSNDTTIIGRGWRSFCQANRIKPRDPFRIKVVENGEKLVLCLCPAETNRDTEESTDANSISTNPSSREESSETEESEEESIEDKSSSRKDCSKPRASSDSSSFVGFLTPSSIRNDELYLTREFVKSNDLNKKGFREVVLTNENGGTWILIMRHNKTHKATLVTRGWNSFCQANGIKCGDSFRFKLVENGEKLVVLRLCSAESKRDGKQVECSEGNDVTSLSTDHSSREDSSETEESEEETEEKSRDDISVKEESEEESIKEQRSLREHCSIEGASSSSDKNRFVTLTITPYSFTSNRMRLPLSFTEVNDIKKPGMITLLAQDGEKWRVHLARENKRGRMRLGSNWKRFCGFHGVKIGESFVLELIWEKDATPVLKFCKKVVNCVRD